MSQSDETLAHVCRQEHPRLVGLLALVVGDRWAAEELAQETLVALCAKWPHVDHPAAWLTRVAVNVGNSWLRRRIAERRAYRRHGIDDPSVELADTADVEQLRHAVAALPKRQRTAVVLRFYEQLSIAETAAVMTCAEGTVKALTHRAMSTLQADPRLSDPEVTAYARRR